MTPFEVLRLLRDVPGVAGSCLLDREARVLVRDLPVDIGDDLLTGIGHRAGAALTAVGRPLPSASGVVLRFERLSVFCGRAGRNILLLLCAPDTSTVSVKTAIQVSASALGAVVEPVPATIDTVTSAPPMRRRSSGIWG